MLRVLYLAFILSTAAFAGPFNSYMVEVERWCPDLPCTTATREAHEFGSYELTFFGGTGAATYQLLAHASAWSGQWYHAEAFAHMDGIWAGSSGGGSQWSTATLPMIFGTPIVGTYGFSVTATSSGPSTSALASMSLLGVFDLDGNPIPFTYTLESSPVPEPAPAVPALVGLALLAIDRVPRRVEQRR